MKTLLWIALSGLIFAETDCAIKITDTLTHVTTLDSGQKVKIERVQNVENVLRDDYTKTSRICPPFCIQPTKVDRKINNIGELELLKFIQEKVLTNKGLLIDTRLKSWYELETIPSAINIPYPAISEKILETLGLFHKKDGSWDGSQAIELLIFDNGVWCEQAKRFLNNILMMNYPKDKILYYRGGFQGWKLLGLTTTVHKEIRVD